MDTTQSNQQKVIDTAHSAYMNALYVREGTENERLKLAKAFLALCVGTRLEKRAQNAVARHEARIASAVQL